VKYQFHKQQEEKKLESQKRSFKIFNKYTAKMLASMCQEKKNATQYPQHFNTVHFR
jgi:hypothetical protein